MSIDVFERYAGHSGTLGYGKEDFQIALCVNGTADSAEAVGAAFDFAPPAVIGRSSLLFLSPFKVTQKGPMTWYLDADYKPEDEDKEEDDEDNVTPIAWKVSWDTGGESAKIFKSRGVIIQGGEGSDDTRVIGWDGKKVNGCEIFVPQLVESIDAFYHPNDVNQDKVVEWSNGTGKVNEEPWLGLDKGEVLCMGNNGEETFAMQRGVATKPVPVTWKIKVSKNLDDIDLGEGLIVPHCDGWDYLDVFFVEKIKGEAPNQISVAVPLRWKVHEIYERINFQQLTGFG